MTFEQEQRERLIATRKLMERIARELREDHQ